MPGEFPKVDMVVDYALKDYTDGALRMIPAMKVLYGEDAWFAYPISWHRVYRNRPPLVAHRYIPFSAIFELPDHATVILLTNTWFETRLAQTVRAGWRQRDLFTRLVFGVDDPEFRFSGDTRTLLDYLGHYDAYQNLFDRAAQQRWDLSRCYSIQTLNLYLVEVTLFLRQIGVETDGSLFSLLKGMVQTALHPFWGYFDLCFGDLDEYPRRDELREFWQPWVEREFTGRVGTLDSIVDVTEGLLRERTRWLGRQARLLSLDSQLLEWARDYYRQRSLSPELRRDLSWLLF